MTVKKFDQHKLQQCVDVLDAFARSGCSVVLHWPVGAPLQCAQWLKAYLA